MKVYMDAHYRFAYTYHSATHPEKVLWEAVYTDKDYQQLSYFASSKKET